MSIISAIIQIYFVIFLGFIFEKIFKLPNKILSYAAIFIFIPCLTFYGLMVEPLELDHFLAPLIFSIVSVLVFLIIFIYTKFFKYNFEDKAATNFLSWISNTGNFGIPVIYFLFSEKALGATFLIIVANTILFYTLGAYVLGQEKNDFKKSLKKVLQLPLIYICFLGIALNLLKIQIPEFIMDPIKMVGDGAVPLQLVVLGTFIAQVKFSSFNKKIVIPSLIGKLILMPTLAILFIFLFKIEQAWLAGVILIECAAPMAVSSVSLADYYERKPKEVSMAVFLSTILVSITLPIFWWLINL